MESLFIQIPDDAKISAQIKLTILTGFVVHGHIYRIACFKYVVYHGNSDI